MSIAQQSSLVSELGHELAPRLVGCVHEGVKQLPHVRGRGDAAADNAARAADATSLVITETLRSGQAAYARGQSLIVLGSVNSGAEAAADGDVIVMGALRGRALAGRAGSRAARIVAGSLQRPELLSIADAFVVEFGGEERLPVNGDKASAGGPVIAALEDDEIIVRQ